MNMLRRCFTIERILLALVAAALRMGCGAAAQIDQPIDKSSEQPGGDPKNPNPPGSQKEDLIYFSGAAAGSELGEVNLPSIADRYVPLSSMRGTMQEQVFLMWLGLIYFKSNPAYEPDGWPAREDPLLVLQFKEQYEAGAWRQLNRGLTLEEAAFIWEYSDGKRLMALINASGPRLSTERIKRKLFLSMDAILDLVALRYWSLQGARRHPLPTLYYDKEGRVGHSIALLDVSPPGTVQRFAYLDPWPGRSLLSEENNKAGIKAQPFGKTTLHFGTRTVNAQPWVISREELARVLVAVFIELDEPFNMMLAGLDPSVPPKLLAELRKAMMALQKQ